MNQIVLLILDGWGLAPKNKANAIEMAKKPFFDKMWNQYPHTELFAHGKYVGLPKNQVGNSEAGHMNIGAGKIIKQDSVIISEAIKNGTFKKNLAISETIDHVKKHNSELHLIGLISDGDSPHSSLDHLFELINIAHEQQIKTTYLHLFTDGRDSPQYAALRILDHINKKIKNKAKIASVIGRFYAMDRAKNWQRTKKAYDSLTFGVNQCFTNYRDAILHSYNQQITDEFIEPTVICDKNTKQNSTRINSDDGVIFFNLRSDRARQLAKCFVQKDFNKKNPKAFKRGKVIKNLAFCALTDFGPDLDHIRTAFPSIDNENSLPTVLENKKQIYIAETEKYAHVTYFINGGFADPINGEKRLRIKSKKIKSYDLQPEMSVELITNKVLDAIDRKFEFIVVNLANSDMVAHTGNIKATLKAINSVDKAIKQITQKILKNNSTIIITSDHGNSEKMLDLETDEIWTGHTTNPVPFILINKKLKNIKLTKGNLSNIAPTIYDLFSIKKLPEGLSKSLIIKS